MAKFIELYPEGSGTENYGGYLINIDFISGPVIIGTNISGGSPLVVAVPNTMAQNSWIYVEYSTAQKAQEVVEQMNKALFNSNPGSGVGNTVFPITGQVQSLEYTQI